ncbi:phytoene desaturase family protein [Halobaculum rubrum]|uniref:phytoene desaturase family protein n=1 Tax=Halobaculum rubrum TaxID=2872158 RepID=UPI001CA41573|nr:phytoene desaturase family protein [Halobaculum rubrum]QZX99108.1 phytoene desaturase [Halobaculum rubrum]
MIDGTPLEDETVTVIGGGVAGLVSACYLADAGATVTVRERNDTLGGVTNRLEVDGFTFDTGPSWYMMPETFDRFFGQFGRSAADYYELERLDPQYRVFFKDGDTVDVTPDLDRTRRLFESYEDGAGDALDEYLKTARRTYEIGMERFVYTDRSRFRDLLDPSIVRAAPALKHLRPMQQYVEGYFDEPKLQQLLQYTLVFLGSSPHETPSLYNLMAHVDFERGVYYPEGGMYSLVEALVDLGRELGVTYRTGQEVTELVPLVDGVRVVAGGESTVADSVVADANPAHVERDLLTEAGVKRDPSYWDEATYGPSALLLYLGVEGSVDPLEHHSLVFPTDWDPHFEQIFDDPGWPDDPAYYLSVASKTDDDVAPDGHHAVVVLVPIAPGLDDDPERVSAFRDQVLADLAAQTDVDLRDRIVVERSVCVSEFAERYRTPDGTALGLAHTLDQTGPLRPAHHAPGVDGLYYTGAFTSPGVGLPMAVISGEHAAEAVARDADPSPISDLAPNL